MYYLIHNSSITLKINDFLKNLIRKYWKKATTLDQNFVVQTLTQKYLTWGPGGPGGPRFPLGPYWIEKQETLLDVEK